MTLIAADINLRESFRAFVLAEAEPWHREHLGRLYDLWEIWNARYFESMLTPPYVLLTPPESPRAFGDCSNISSFGGRCQIRVRLSLLMGTHPHLRPGDEYAEGRFRFVADVLLHESIHQWHYEITGDPELSYHGHGPAFAAVCNQIGADLGLPPVRSMKKRGPEKDLPSCAQWPINVRPHDYYLGAYRRHDQATSEELDTESERDEEIAEPARSPLAELLDQALGHLDANRIQEARTIIAALRAHC
jgi:hypothetical protein